MLDQQEQTEPKSGLDALKDLPMEKRLICLLQMLDKLQKSNLVKQHHPELTRAQADENKCRQGAVKAYADTSKFITGLFKDELRVALTPKSEEATDGTPSW